MPATRNPTSQLQKIIAAAFVVLFLFVVAFSFYVRAEKQIDRANDLRLMATQLSDELRQSSDDLTRMVRTYAVTGDLLYKKHFNEILDIRDGKTPRPRDYNLVYWDLVQADDHRPRPYEKSIPLLDLMKQAAVSDAEFAKLAEAKANSDGLTSTEFSAMRLIEAPGPDKEANKVRAIAMLHDVQYHEAKAAIMLPILQFQKMLEIRTNASVEEAENLATLLRAVFILLGILLAALLARIFHLLYTILGGTVDDIHGHISRLGRGDFSASIPIAPRQRDSVLAWLAQMQEKLQHTDIERKSAEQRIHELAFFDHLTGLPNRVLLIDRIKQALASSTRSGSFGALLFIDLDDFKVLNDTKGHDIGDLLLIKVAERLQHNLRLEDTVARLGGDEFVVLLMNLGKEERAVANAVEVASDKILKALSGAYTLGQAEYRCTASIGATLFSNAAVGVDGLMKQADLAMYRAKEAGRNAVRFFDPTMEAAVRARVELEVDLRQAILQSQFQLHYQAQIMDGGRVVGAEALIRWRHPLRGLVPPLDFIPFAETSDVIIPIGLWVLQTACLQLAAWAGTPGFEHLTLAVNVSSRQFRHPDFVTQVLGVLEATGANPRLLKLELTESHLIHDADDVIDKMVTLQARGVAFALDDFGTGYSSLAYLKRLPLDQLKIDQSFIRDLLNDPNDAAIARTVVALAQSLGLTVIAEGVETAAQWEKLVDMGCHAFQGYYFCRPAPVESFEAYARQSH